jgi:hypothetical protein
MRGTPGGRQKPSGSSLPLVSLRCLNISAAAGLNGTSFKPEVMSSENRIPGGSQIPERSGLPSAVRGAGAAWLGSLFEGSPISGRTPSSGRSGFWAHKPAHRINGEMSFPVHMSTEYSLFQPGARPPAWPRSLDPVDKCPSDPEPCTPPADNPSRSPRNAEYVVARGHDRWVDWRSRRKSPARLAP